ncbi:hypothetical protein [Sphingomonas faeni]|uniref:hypothetical protein n=1 Tax=Sphingomonas faeni TaxID=185950 RepID=UPI0033524B28
MFENMIEAGAAMTRIRFALEDVELRPAEIETLLGLAPGAWNEFAMGRPLVAMTRLQETRARLAVELLNALCSLLPRADDVGEWMRRGNRLLEGGTPLAWSAASLDNLRALVAAIRGERHDVRRC